MTCAIVLTLLFASPGWAQDRASHAPIPPSNMPEPVDRLLMMQKLDLIMRDIKNNQRAGNEAMVHARNSILSQLAANPELKRMALELARKHGVDVSTLAAHAANAPFASSFAGAPDGRSGPSERTLESLRKWNLDKLAHRLEPALQDALRKAGQGDLAQPGPITMEQVENVMHRFEGWIEKIQTRLPDSVRNIADLDVRRHPSPREYSLPTTLFAPSSLAKVAQAAMIILAVGASGWFLMHLTIEPRRHGVRDNHTTLFEPDQVNTREDLILAFDRMALVFFGTDAAHWHHRLIARRLGEMTSDPTDADTLATLYEQARYAPGVPELDWRKSREPLRRIALGRR